MTVILIIATILIVWGIKSFILATIPSTRKPELKILKILK
jgi:hypothetical protein